MGASGRLTCMARKVRVEYEGAIYHGIKERREAIFRDDGDR